MKIDVGDSGAQKAESSRTTQKASDKFKQWRLKNRLSYRDAAELAGVSAATLHRVETGQCDVSVSVARGLAMAMCIKDWKSLL